MTATVSKIRVLWFLLCTFLLCLFYRHSYRCITARQNVEVYYSIVPDAQILQETLSPEQIYQNRLRETLEHSQDTLLAIKMRCRSLGLKTQWNFKYNFAKPRLLISKRSHRILYASNPKVGSTNFKRFLFMLDGVEGWADFHNQSAGHYERVRGPRFFSSFEEFAGQVKVVAIRNPLTRLVSAFRDSQIRKNKNFEPQPNTASAAGGRTQIPINQNILAKLLLRKVINGGLSLSFKESLPGLVDPTGMEPAMNESDIALFHNFIDTILKEEHPDVEDIQSQWDNMKICQVSCRLLRKVIILSFVLLRKVIFTSSETHFSSSFRTT